ncbi:MAG: hypothetical protein ACLUSP_09805 [Christensenellales bacterium]
MFAEHKIVVSERSAGADSVRASGVIISDICGETEDGLIASYRVETPFSEEWGADGASAGDAVFVRACVSGKENLAADGDTYAVDLTYEIAFDYSVYAPDRVTLVCDLFSSDRELIVGSESAPVNIAKGGYTITDRVEGNVTLEVNMPLADNILAATGTRLTVTNLLASDDEVLVEGIVSGSVIYYSAEDNVTSGALVELPFSITSRLDGARTGDELCGRGTVTSTSLKIRRGNEIDIKADIAVEIESVRPENVTVITSVEGRNNCKTHRGVLDSRDEKRRNAVGSIQSVGRNARNDNRTESGSYATVRGRREDRRLPTLNRIKITPRGFTACGVLRLTKPA